ncbi:MAG: twin-arginine translocase TatA/TatE family subunit [Bacteroidales bacterium]|nr:twin-arginine translocase TatA/TatE family subunit [Bacteroidales bacterium]
MLAFFNISGGELFIIVLVIFLIFGPDKIPEIARWMGKGINQIKRATSEIRDEIDRETGDIRKTTQNIKQELNEEFRQLNPDVNPEKFKKTPSVATEKEEINETYTDPYNLDQVPDKPDKKIDNSIV